ncbi:zinc-ribbon domain-containing protein [Bacillus cereus]
MLESNTLKIFSIEYPPYLFPILYVIISISTNTGKNHISANSHKIVWWQCKQGHEWEAPVKQRKNGGRNCPICNSIFTTHPDIAVQWHPKLNKGALPYGITYGSDVQAWWICSCGYEWKEEIAKRTGRKRQRLSSLPKQNLKSIIFITE